MMLRPKALTEVLSQANTGGVRSSLLLNREGALLAFAGYNDDSKITAPIASNIWNAYEKNARTAFQDTCKIVLIEAEDGRVGITNVAGLLLCLYCTNDTELGLLRRKLDALRDVLEEPLLQVASL